MGASAVVNVVLFVGVVGGVITATLCGVRFLQPYLNEKQWKQAEECKVQDVQLMLNAEQNMGLSLRAIMEMQADADDQGLMGWGHLGLGDLDFGKLGSGKLDLGKMSFGWGKGRGKRSHRGHGRGSSSEESHESHEGRRPHADRRPGGMDDGDHSPEEWNTDEECPEEVMNMMEGFGRSFLQGGMPLMGKLEPCVRVIASYEVDWREGAGILHKDLKDKNQEMEMCTHSADLSNPQEAMADMARTIGPYLKSMFMESPIECYYKPDDEDEERFFDEGDDLMYDMDDDSFSEEKGRDKRQAVPVDMHLGHVLNRKIYSPCRAITSVVLPSVIAGICLLILIVRLCKNKKSVRSDAVEEKYAPGVLPGSRHTRSASVCTVTVDASAKAKEAWGSWPTEPTDSTVGVAPSYEDAMKTGPPSYLFVTAQGVEEEKKVDLSKTDPTVPEKF